MSDIAHDTDRPRTVSADPPRPRSGADDPPRPRRYAVFAVVGLALLMFSLDQTSVATALTTISTDLGADLAWTGWVITAAAVGQILALPLGGWLSNRFGGRWMFLGGVALFTLFSVLSAFSGSIGQLIACRFAQGLAGGVMMPAASGVVAYQFGRDRDRALALFTSVFPIGAIAGPLLGGVILTTWTWHGIFLVNLPAGILLLAAGVLLVPDPPRPGQARMDVRGIVLLVLTLLGLMLTVTRLGALGVAGPSLPVTLASAAVAVGAGAVFVRHTRRRPDSVIPLRLLTGRGLGSMNAANVLFGAVAIGFSATLPLYAQVRYGMAPLAAGVMLTGRAVGTIVASAPAVVLLRRTGHRPLMLAGIAMIVTGLVATAVPPPGVSAELWLLLGTTVLGLGTGLVIPASNNAGMHLVPDEVAAVSGLRIMFRQIGGIVAVSTITAVISASDRPGVAGGIAFVVLAVLLVGAGTLAARVPNHRGRW
ncbi:MFS transporter [Pseudonocardia nematodicida]|uniref:MFS transporter n=1 Tax=Pseudonocardia nematodicida TaxID=1206997 RepID=A0ABV1KJN6_9PSEU